MKRDSGQASIVVVAGSSPSFSARWCSRSSRAAARGRPWAQRAADLGALAAARAMHDAYGQLFEPVYADHARPGREHVSKREYLTLGRAAAERVARAKRRPRRARRLPDASSFAPVRVRVTVRDLFEVRTGTLAARRTSRQPPRPSSCRRRPVSPHPAAARGPARQPPGSADAARRGAGVRPPGARRPGGRDRPHHHQRLSFRRRAGRLFAATGPRWVAPPGRSFHRLGTELDLGPRSAYGWLAAHARRFHFVQRYGWNPRTSAYARRPLRTPGADDAKAGARCPTSSRPRSPLRSPAPPSDGTSRPRCSRHSSTPKQLRPLRGRRRGGARVGQSMPGTAAPLGSTTPSTPRRTIDAQAHLMRRPAAALPRRPAHARRLQRRPTRLRPAAGPRQRRDAGYVARILGLIAGAEPAPSTALTIKLTG